MPTLDEILEALERASEFDELQSISEIVRDFFSIDHINYHWVSSSSSPYVCGTHSKAWIARYHEKEYLRVDPVIQGCFQRFHPVDWKRLDWSGKAARALQADAIAHGVGTQGYSVPIRGPNGQFALFTLNHTCSDEEWADFMRRNRCNFLLIAHYFNQKALEFEPERAPELAQSLSPREIDAMTLLAMGYSRAQVAETLSISEHTLRVYIESARYKLGAVNTTNAVARALSRGLIVI
ncbi:helix-turn-helix transcriptional regulator [Marimonas lutisalis]|uniref:helix-turn-helix transcriptional regulator n=1 Tax=Marimonas lutisalis TaxID=2545756 RepID=UPI001F34027E|nr:LuxR family transcriptional regulator [Marimonas lutisalis]